MISPSRRRFIVSTALLAGSAFLPPARGATELDKILRRHAAARGSLRALRAMAAKLDLTVDGVTVSLHYAATRISAPPFLLARADVFLGGAHYSMGTDAEGPWLIRPFDEGLLREPLPDIMQELAFNFIAIEDLPAQGTALRYVGRANSDGSGSHIIEATFQDGGGWGFFLDPESWLIVSRRDARLLAGTSVDFLPTETRWDNYRRVEGVQTAFKIQKIDLSTLRPIWSATITTLDYNTPVTEAMLSPTSPPL